MTRRNPYILEIQLWKLEDRPRLPIGNSLPFHYQWVTAYIQTESELYKENDAWSEQLKISRIDGIWENKEFLQ